MPKTSTYLAIRKLKNFYHASEWELGGLRRLRVNPKHIFLITIIKVVAQMFSILSLGDYSEEIVQKMEAYKVWVSWWGVCIKIV